MKIGKLSKTVQTYKRSLVTVTSSNKEFQEEIHRLNKKMKSLENCIYRLNAAQVEAEEIEKELKKFQVVY